MASNEEKLNKLFSLMDDENSASKKDVTTVFRALIDRINELQTFVSDKATSLNDLVLRKIDEMQKIKDDTESGISSMKELLSKAGETQQTLTSTLSKIEKKAGLFDRLAALVPQKNDLIQASVSKLHDRVSDVEDSIPDTEILESRIGALESREEMTIEGEEIATELESLEGEQRLDISAIKGFEERFKTLMEEFDTHISGRMNGLIVAQQRGAVRAYDLSSKLDGSTKTFTLPAFGVILLVQLSSFPNTLRSGIDYTVSNAAMQITFGSSIDASTVLSVGQTCIIVYAEN